MMTSVRSNRTLGTLIAFAAAGLFVLAAGSAGPVERFGGAAWVFILMWIILMPVLAARARGR